MFDKALCLPGALTSKGWLSHLILFDVRELLNHECGFYGVTAKTINHIACRINNVLICKSRFRQKRKRTWWLSPRHIGV